MLRDVVWIKTFPDEAAASQVCELLRPNGIEFVVTEDPGWAAERAPDAIGGYRLGVRADDVRAALTILWNTRLA